MRELPGRKSMMIISDNLPLNGRRRLRLTSIQTARQRRRELDRRLDAVDELSRQHAQPGGELRDSRLSRDLRDQFTEIADD